MPPNPLYMWKVTGNDQPDVLYGAHTDWNKRFGPLSHVELVEFGAVFAARPQWQSNKEWGTDYVGRCFDVEVWPDVLARVMAEAQRRNQYDTTSGEIVVLGTVRLTSVPPDVSRLR